MVESIYPGPDAAISLRYAVPAPEVFNPPGPEPRWRQLKTVQAVGEIWQGAKADYHNVREDKGALRAGLLVGQAALTTAVTIPYLVGGLESTAGAASSTVFQHGGNAIEVALAAGGVSTIAELSLTVLMAGCLKYFKQAAAALERRREYEKKEFSKLGTASLMVTTGSPGMMLRSAVHTPQDNHAWKGVKTAGILFPVNATVFGSAVGGGFNFVPEWVIDAAVNPLYWLAGFVGYKGIKTAVDSVRARRAAKAAQ